MHSLFAQIATAVPTSAWGLLISVTPVTKGILILLAVLSLVSWAIIIAKWREFVALRRRSTRFLTKFENVTRFDQASALAAREDPNPYTRVLRRAGDFLTGPIGSGAGGASGGRGVTLTGAQVEALRMLLDAETSTERDRLSRFIAWLGTIGSVSPLIGLLGTVLGIIDAFVGISTRGSGNIGAVAPGVAEALTATAAALTVAIPAVFGYNLFASRLNRFESELDGFGSAVIALIVRDRGQ